MRHSRSESGFALIEAIVAAAVLAMLALAVLSGVDGATSASGREQARAVAASLAEQDQDRLRSMNVATLSKYSDPARTVTVDGVDYKVASTTRWVRDDTSAASSCTAGDSKQSDYLSITSTVTSNVVGVRGVPVSVQSIVTPTVSYSATAGSLAVQVNNRSSVGVPNLSVSISGASSATRLTDANGCALFEVVPEGDYTITLNRAGWVDVLGNPSPTAPAKVIRGTLTKQAMVYDQAATATLAIKTYQPGTTTPMISAAGEVSTVQGSNPVRIFPATSGVKSTIVASNLFPFTAAYPFYTGSCTGENPAAYTSTYFNAAGGKALQTDPGGTYIKDVFQPPVNLRVTRAASGAAPGSKVTVTATYQPGTADAGCVDKVTFNLATNPTPNTPGWLTQNGSPNAYDPGLPFGKWSICVLDTTPSPDLGFKMNASYDNTGPNGQASTVDLTAGTSTNSNPFNKTVAGMTRVSSC